MNNFSRSYSQSLKAPSVKEFTELRRTAGWPDLTPQMIECSLQHSLFHVTVREQGKLVGMGRIVGDGFMYFYLQDLVVATEHQGLGVGKMLMTAIEQYLAEHAAPGATIGLMSAKGKEGFYKEFGYIQRPSETLGHGMCKFV